MSLCGEITSRGRRVGGGSWENGGIGRRMGDIGRMGELGEVGNWGKDMGNWEKNGGIGRLVCD